MRLATLTPLLFGFLIGSTVTACADDAGEEACFDVIPKRDDTVGICGYTNGDLTQLAGGQDTQTRSQCFSLDACPDACPAAAVIGSEVQPEFESMNPNFTISESFPLCREDDVASQQCCFWVLFAGLSG